MACQGVLISQEPGSHGSLGTFSLSAIRHDAEASLLTLTKKTLPHLPVKHPLCFPSSTFPQHHEEKAQQPVTKAYQDSRASN